MFCPKCGGLGKFDDFAETDLGEVPFYQCESCDTWFYGEAPNTTQSGSVESGRTLPAEVECTHPVAWRQNAICLKCGAAVLPSR